MNRIVWTVVVLLVLLAVICGSYFWFGGADGGDALAGWGKGELSKAEVVYYQNRVKRIVDFWQNAAKWTSQWRNDGRIEQPNDVFLVIDAKKPAVWVEYKGRVVEELYSDLSEGMDWQIHHLTPDGNKRLADLVRLQVRGVHTSRIVPETIYLTGIGRGWHMDYSIRSNTCGYGNGTSVQRNIPNVSFRKRSDKEPYESIIVDEEESAAYMTALKERDEYGSDEGLVELLFNGSDEYRGNFRKWRAVEKRMYAEMARQLSRQGYGPGSIELGSGPDFLAGHAELDGRDRGLLGSRSVDVNLNYVYLGDDLWHVFSVPGRFPGRRRDKLDLDFFVSADRIVDENKAERLKAEMIYTAQAENEKLGPSKWRAELGNGVMVEFIGLCENPSGGKKWFGPDGSELGFIPVSSFRRFGNKENPRQIYEIAIRVHWPGGGPSGSTGTVEGSKGSYSGSNYDKYGYNIAYQNNGLSINGYGFEKDRQKTTMRCGFKVGEDGKYYFVRFENISLVRGKDMGFKVVAEEENSN